MRNSVRIQEECYYPITSDFLNMLLSALYTSVRDTKSKRPYNDENASKQVELFSLRCHPDAANEGEIDRK